ncbi:hypothetical protein [Muribaculum intestinale]|nr:hypothetical protein [Muribaculum intestinale]
MGLYADVWSCKRNDNAGEGVCVEERSYPTDIPGDNMPCRATPHRHNIP